MNAAVPQTKDDAGDVLLGHTGSIGGYYQSWFVCYNCGTKFDAHIKQGVPKIRAMEVLMSRRLVCQNCGCEAFPAWAGGQPAIT